MSSKRNHSLSKFETKRFTTWKYNYNSLSKCWRALSWNQHVLCLIIGAGREAKYQESLQRCITRNTFLAKVGLYPPLYSRSCHPFYLFYFMYGSLKLPCVLTCFLVYFMLPSLKHKPSQGRPVSLYSSGHSWCLEQRLAHSKTPGVPAEWRNNQRNDLPCGFTPKVVLKQK